MKQRVYMLIVLLFISTVSFAVSNSDLVIVSGPKSDVSEVSYIVLKEAYSKLNINLKIIHLSNVRSLDASNSGKYAGELHRAKTITKKYSNLIRIPVPIQEIEFHAYVRDRSIKIREWRDLEKHQFAYVRGIYYVKKNSPQKNAITVSDNSQLFKLLDANRYNVAVANYLTAQQIIKKNNYKIKSAGELGSIKLYHFLNKNNRKLVPKITQILRKMQELGRIRQIRRDYIKRMRY